MTLPSTINLPLHQETLYEDINDIQIYLKELTVALQDMYIDIAQAVNGDISTNDQVENDWTPTLAGTTIAGTFTYTHQIGWSLRQGIMTDVWFDIGWSASGLAAGNLYIELPYLVNLSEEKPFVGVCQTSDITYTGGTGIVINGIPNTYRAELWNVGSGFTTANQAVVSSGQVIGHLRYIGVDDE